MAEWQPIETAPRDGTWFVICRAGEPELCEAGCFKQLMWSSYTEAHSGLYRKVERSISDWQGFNNFHRATHWAPLPPVPDAKP